MNMHFASLLVGFASALVLWQLLMTFARVPIDNRGYRDSPAMGFRLVWPLIRLLVFNTSALMSKRTLDKLKGLLARAGVEYSLNAEEIWASRVISAFLFAVATLSVHKPLGSMVLVFMPMAAMVGYHYPENWLKQKAVQRRDEVLKSLPFYLDVITLSVEAGSNLTGGITQAVQRTVDSALRRELGRVLRDIRSGKTRADALRDFAQRVDSTAVNQVVSGLIQGEKAGANLGPMLRAQSEQLRVERFQRAEKKALEAPVKLLAPLFLCIFPMTFVALGFVMLSKAIVAGFISSPWIVWAYGWPG